LRAYDKEITEGLADLKAELCELTRIGSQPAVRRAVADLEDMVDYVLEEARDAALRVLGRLTPGPCDPEGHRGSTARRIEV
jgi:hypothetical protein